MSRLYRIEVTQERRAILWVVGDSEDEALEDGEELACSIQDREWDYDDMDSSIEDSTDSPPPNGVLVWTGGPDGDDRAWSADLLDVDY